MTRRIDPRDHARRKDYMAKLVADGYSVADAGAILCLTRGQAARIWANIKADLGPQAC